MSRKRKSRQSSVASRDKQHSDAANPQGPQQVATVVDTTTSTKWLAVGTATVAATLVWAYWPTLVEVVHKWETQPDYSHGFLVLPIALFFLWSRRAALPWADLGPSHWGLLLLLAAVSLRIVAGRYYMLPLDAWTLPLMLGGALWMLFGTRFMMWSWSAIVFLWFMFPIPYSAERWLSIPLQKIATQFSTAILVMLGQPAIAEGNIIQLGDHTLFVEEACSGMRILIGIFALAFAFVLFSNWSWWQKLMVLVAALPIAIFANVLRIVATGLLYQLVSDDAGQKFSHDFAGYVIIPIAALFLWLFLIYLDRLFPLVEEIRQPVALYGAATATSENS
jgi:exosortase